MKFMTTHFVIVLALIAKYWYRVTTKFSRYDCIKISKYKDASSITHSDDINIKPPLDSGKYKSDLFKGKLDVMIHPSMVQYRIDNNLSIGDCEDYSGYLISAISLSNEKTKAFWLGVYYMQHSDKSVSGHAVCVYEKENGKKYFIDYSLPIEISTDWEWAIFDSERRNSKLISACTIEVKNLNEFGDLSFGKIKTYRHK